METTTFVWLCIAVLLPASSDSFRKIREASTTPPIEYVLPARDHTDMLCTVFDKPQKCGKLSLHGHVFNVTCNEGFFEDGFNGSSLYTLYVNGTWAPTTPECKRFCKLPKPSNVDVRCQLRGKNIDCSKLVPVGTEATGRCKMGFLPIDKNADASIVCEETGNWSGNLMECKAAVCGKNSTESIPLSFVTIREKDTENSDLWTCFGTLISPHLVLTSAQCVCFAEGRRVKSLSNFEVIVGKHFKDYSFENLIEETVGIRQIIVHPHYFGNDTNFAFDIALVVLETSVTSMPACVDWDQEFLITPGEIGMTTAFAFFYTALYVQFEYVDYASCVCKMSPNLRSSMTNDKFCTRIIINATTFGSGAGLVFEKNGVNYVKGVRSGRPDVMSGQKFQTATNLSDAAILHWLHQTRRLLDAAYNDSCA